MDKRAEQRLTEANKLIFVKRYGEAERVLDDLLAVQEHEAANLVYVRRIELAALLKKLDRLKSRYLKELKSESDQGRLAMLEACIVLIDLHGSGSSSPEAIGVLQDILRRHGAHPVPYYAIAWSLEVQGNHDRAIYNYEQALSADPNFYIAWFGLSQIYYQMGDEKRGDHFFYLFEQAAPYNVYGNFDTHRRLSQEYLEKDAFAEAEGAIHSLCEWWIENKGSCPAEIQVYELLATARIAAAQGDRAQAEIRRTRGLGLASTALDDPKTPEGVLYFLAKILEEFDDAPRALAFYKRIMREAGTNPAIVQKIGNQFLTLGEFRLAKELFEEGYNAHPENPDIRFCLLVANLKIAGVNVEEYLIGRERLRQLVDAGGDRVELLALLHSLLARFDGDPDVQGHIADVYLKLGNLERAARHYEAMYTLDGKNRQTALKYATFEMQHRNPEAAMQALASMGPIPSLPPEAQAEVWWLRASYHARKSEHREALELLTKIMSIDPWNVSYVVQEAICLTAVAPVDEEARKPDPVLRALQSSDEGRLDWTSFEEVTNRLLAQRAYGLVYARHKLQYLYTNGSEECLLALVQAACHHDAARGVYDFTKLLNTNFDSYNIYWALGMVHKELWRLETASSWFEQMLLYPSLPKEAQARAYLELADCYAWQNHQHVKAVEFARLAMDLFERKDERALRTLAHAYLRAGQVRQAKLYLEQTDPSGDPEARFLHGLLHYRNGARIKANEVWKPLLSFRSESLRIHHIKQDVLKYYFEGEPYLKAN